MKHHYVPQFLLRAWAKTTPDKKLETFRLDLPNVPSSRHAPRGTAYEDDLYALTMPKVAGMEKQAVEKLLLRDIDNRAAIVLQKLNDTGFSNLTLENRFDWTRFLMSLRLRQPNVIQQLRTESSEHLATSLRDSPEEYEVIAGYDDPPTLEEWVRQTYPGLIENFGLSFFHELVDNPEIGEKLLHMKWWLWHFDEERNELLLADHPCIFTKGIDDPGLVIALPIGPRTAFIATKTDRVADIMRRQSPGDLLIRMNESSLGQARVRIYSRNALPRRFVSNRLAQRR